MNIATFGLRVDPSGAVQGAAEAKKALQALKLAAQEVSNALGEMGQGTDENKKKLGELESQADGMAETLKRLAAAAGFTAFVKMGLDFNSAVEDAVNGIAAIQRQFHPENFKSVVEALGTAKKAVEDLRIAANESPATFQELVGAFSATAGAAAKANLSLEQHTKLIVTMSQALKTLGIPGEQMLSETRSLLTGNITADSDAAKTLGITKEAIEQATAAGTLYDYLMSKMSAFSEAAVLTNTAVSTQFGNLKDALQAFAGATTQQLFESLHGQIQGVTDALKKPEAAQALANILSLLTTLTTILAGLAQFTLEHAALVGAVVKAYVAWWAAAKVIQFGTMTAGILATATAFRAQAAAAETSTAALLANRAAGALLAAGPQIVIAAGVAGMMYIDSRANEILQRIDQMKAKALEVSNALGTAETDSQKAAVRGDALKQIQDLQQRLASISDNPLFVFDQQERESIQAMIGYYQDLLKRVEELGGAQAEYNRVVQATQKNTSDTLQYARELVDAADDQEKRDKARLVLVTTIGQIEADMAAVANQPQILGIYNQMLPQFKTLLAQFDALAGKNTIVAAQQKQQADDQALINKVLMQELDLQQAKRDGNELGIRQAQEEKRIQELQKNELLSQVKNKELLLDFVKKIVAAEQQALDIQKAQSNSDKNRAYALSGLTGDAKVKVLEQQLAQVKQEQASNLSREGYPGFDAGASSYFNSQLTGGTDRYSVTRDAAIISARDKVRELEVALDEARKAAEKMDDGLLGAAAGLKQHVQTDVATLKELEQQMNMLNKLRSTGQMSQTEFDRRSGNLKDQAAGGLADPMSAAKQYPKLLDQFRAYKAEQEQIEKQYNTRMEANQTGMLESFNHGVQKMSKSWGTMSQQIDKLGQGVAQSFATNISDGFTAMITGSKSAGDAFRDMAVGILNDIAKMIIQMLVQMAIQQAINALRGYADGGQVSSPNTGATAYFSGGSVHTSGGSSGAVDVPRVTVPNNPSVDAPLPTGGAGGGFNMNDNPITDSLGEPSLFAGGGGVRGGRGGIDDIPAMLTAGEYVIPKDVANYYGTRWLDAVREKKVHRFAAGGQVGPTVRPGARGAAGGGDTYQFSIHVDARGGGDDEESQDKKRKKGENWAKQMETIARQVVRDERRPGGASYGKK